MREFKSFEWYAVRTNPRCEDRASKSIKDAGFEAYAPKFPRMVMHKRKKKFTQREFNMLVGWIFVRLPMPAPFGFVRGCDGVQRFAGMGNRPIAIPDNVIASVEHLESSTWLDFDQQFRSQISTKRRRRKLPPRPIHISTGPLRGFVGYILDETDRKAVKVITSAFAELHEVTLREEEFERAA